MKTVAYLFGAGISHAEAGFVGGGVSLLTKDITEGIQKRLEYSGEELKRAISNDLSVERVDVEQLISLYESTGTSIDNKAAAFLREAFMLEISTRLKRLDRDRTRFIPRLTSALFELHKRYQKVIGEKLVGVMTLNYDDYAERALQGAWKQFGLGFDMHVDSSAHSFYELAGNPLLLKLHGSFNWQNDFPPSMTLRGAEHSDDCLWIPPGVEKKRERFPFNILWGRAKELLKCDILRVIGCSLSRNDWQLISLLHSAKRAGLGDIEDIDYQNVGMSKQREYPYLGIRLLLDTEGFRKFLARDRSIRDLKTVDKLAESDNSKSFNCFHEWLRFRKSVLEEHLETLGRDLDKTKHLKSI